MAYQAMHLNNLDGHLLQDEAAVATPLGLYLNCASAGLYMANYQLVIPTVSRFLHHMGVDQSAAGLVIGCCDIASIPVTVGTYEKASVPLGSALLVCQARNRLPCMPRISSTALARPACLVGTAWIFGTIWIWITNQEKQRCRTAASPAQQHESSQQLARSSMSCCTVYDSW